MKISGIQDTANDPLIFKKKHQMKQNVSGELEDDSLDVFQIESQTSQAERTERVSSLKEQVADGSYYVSSYDIADKFLRGALVGFA